MVAVGDAVGAGFIVGETTREKWAMLATRARILDEAAAVAAEAAAGPTANRSRATIWESCHATVSNIVL